MATVYLAEDAKHNRLVAIKVMRPALVQAIGQDRFLREIEIAARLNHPHVVPLFDSGAAGDHLFYVMPFVEGESLRARLAREGRLPLEEALRLSREIASALEPRPSPRARAPRHQAREHPDGRGHRARRRFRHRALDRGRRDGRPRPTR